MYQLVMLSYKDGSTALHWACWNGHMDVVKFLISQGASLPLHTRKGKHSLGCIYEQIIIKIYITNNS